MRVDVDSYKLNKPFVRQWYEKHKVDYTPSKSIAILAVSTMVPCIVIAYWIGEITNWPPEIICSIERLMLFYGYTEILNKPAGAPL